MATRKKKQQAKPTRIHRCANCTRELYMQESAEREAKEEARRIYHPDYKVTDGDFLCWHCYIYVFMPWLGGEDFEAFKKAMAELTEQERELVKSRFEL